MDSIESTPVTRALDALGIAYRLFCHPGPIHSLEQAASERGQRPEQIVRSILFRLAEDEFVMVTAGECVLVQDAGETVMRAGDCAAFPANVPDGHHFINRSVAPASFLVVGSKSTREVATYSDVDLVVTIDAGKAAFTRKDGAPYIAPET